MSYDQYRSLLMQKFDESDTYFYNIRSLIEKIFGYYNVGTDLCDGEFCGNTILCALYTPIDTFNNEKAGLWIKEISNVAGKLAAFFGCVNYPTYKYNDNIPVHYKDYHFYKNCPLKEKTEFGFLLFSILCSINYATEFINKYFVEEIPQKFKFAYLQYYYLCDFIKQINVVNGTNFYINASLKDRSFRNCLAHYGLGQYMKEEDLRLDDMLMGLTNKAFNMDYITAKEHLYTYLSELVQQIKLNILI